MNTNNTRIDIERYIQLKNIFNCILFVSVGYHCEFFN